jgi:polyisoprenoid-binding protein YceI
VPAARKTIRWVLAGAVVVLAIVLVAPFVYIHFIEGKPPAKLSLSSVPATGTPATAAPATTAGSSGTAAAASGGATTSAASGAAGSTATSVAPVASGPAPAVDGTWAVTSASQAGYRVKEVLFGQSTEAVGRTNSITGSFAASGTHIDNASFTVDLTTMKSDQSQRDRQFQDRIMQTSKFPTATFTLKSPITLPSTDGVVSVTANGDLSLHGVTKSVAIPLKAQRNGNNIEVNGSLDVTFADYGIDNPSLGPAQTQDHGLLEFLLVFAKQ